MNTENNLGEEQKETQSIVKMIDVLKITTKLSLDQKFSSMPVLQGKPGIAKTALIRKMAKDLNYDIITISGMKPMEYFSGLPITDKLISEDGDVGEAIWTKPELIAKANKVSDFNRSEKNGRKVILFIDDIHLLGESAKYFFELILDKSLNGHTLNDDVIMIGASNDSDLSSYEGFSAPVINRMMLTPVRLDFTDWYKSVGISINKYIASFLKSNAIFRNEQEDNNSPFGSYRSWTEFSILFNEMSKSMNEEEVVKMIGKSFVSKNASEALVKSIVIQKEFNFEDILSKKTIPKPDVEGTNQILYTNILRYVTTKEEMVKVTKMVLLCSKEGQKYSLFLENFVMELIYLKEMYEADDQMYLENKSIHKELEKSFEDLQKNEKIQEIILECM